MKRSSENGCIERTGHTPFLSHRATVRARPQTREERVNGKNTLLCRWNGNEEPVAVTPDKLTLSRAFPIVNLVGEHRRKLRMIEHWAAIPILTGVPTFLEFTGRNTPYSTSALTDVAAHMAEQEWDEPIPYRSPIWSFDFSDGDASVHIRPRLERNLIVHGHFDFRKCPGLSHLGEQSATFDSKTSDLKEFTGTRVPTPPDSLISPFIRLLMTFRSTLRECVLPMGDGERSDPNEVARHKILDFLGLLNMGNFFLSAEVFIHRAGHRVQLAAIHEFLRQLKTGEQELC